MSGLTAAKNLRGLQKRPVTPIIHRTSIIKRVTANLGISDADLETPQPDCLSINSSENVVQRNAYGSNRKEPQEIVVH